jgi:hypothetical protein
MRLNGALRQTLNRPRLREIPVPAFRILHPRRRAEIHRRRVGRFSRLIKTARHHRA